MAGIVSNLIETFSQGDFSDDTWGEFKTKLKAVKKDDFSNPCNLSLPARRSLYRFGKSCFKNILDKNPKYLEGRDSCIELLLVLKI